MIADEIPEYSRACRKCGELLRKARLCVRQESLGEEEENDSRDEL